MRCISLLFLLLSLVLIPACTAVPEQFTPLEPQVIDAANIVTVEIQIDSGSLRILESVDSSVRINGRVLNPERLERQTSTIGSQMVITFLAHQGYSSTPPLDVNLEVPKQIQVKIKTDDASVVVQGYHGDVEVDSTSGNITIEQMQGELMLNSNRGNITVEDSSGKISVVGNYGALTLQDTSGDASVSTIMGHVRFEGSIQSGDNARLETDHGAVSVNVKKDSALILQARSTSGDVTCLIPGMTSTTRTCEGTMDSGAGRLSIRTVSGSVTLQLIP